MVSTVRVRRTTDSVASVTSAANAAPETPLAFITQAVARLSEQGNQTKQLEAVGRNSRNEPCVLAGYSSLHSPHNS
jgi:hypothetical protein